MKEIQKECRKACIHIAVFDPARRIIFVTGFAKTVPIGTTIKIHFMA